MSKSKCNYYMARHANKSFVIAAFALLQVLFLFCWRTMLRGLRQCESLLLRGEPLEAKRPWNCVLPSMPCFFQMLKQKRKRKHKKEKTRCLFGHDLVVIWLPSKNCETGDSEAGDLWKRLETFLERLETNVSESRSISQNREESWKNFCKILQELERFCKNREFDK